MLKVMARMVKPGGKVCFWDPLRHNPIINIYRMMAGRVRSRNERPLDISIVGHARDIFSDVSYDTFWFFTLWIFMRFYIVERVRPNSERYWKKIIAEEKRLRPTYLRLERLDDSLKRIVPFVLRYAWNIAVVATK